MTISYVIDGTSAFRWTCDVCGYHRSDIGVETTSLIQARHICKESGMPAGKTIILLCWEELDTVMDKLMLTRKEQAEFVEAWGTEDPARAAEITALQNEARGMAKIMTHWSLPHFRTVEEVSKESLARWTARQAGEERHTRGTVIVSAGADLEATYALQGVGRPSSRPARTTTPASKPKKKFTDEEVAAIRGAHAAGFDMSMLTTAYKCTPEDIEAALKG